VITGIAYPLAMTCVAQTLFPSQANGTLIMKDNKVIGSSLIGQQFTSDRYFHGRPSAAGEGYNAASSGGSNLAPTSAALLDRVKSDVTKLLAENPNQPVPVDLVTASGSGLCSRYRVLRKHADWMRPNSRLWLKHIYKSVCWVCSASRL
jgi:K+-transporting ATPase ATPase C chain